MGVSVVGLHPLKYSTQAVYIGSPWGAGTVTGPDGSRLPSALELETAGLQGQQFYAVVSRASFAH